MQKTFIILSPFILLITIGLFFGLISPTLEQIEIKQEEIQTKEIELQELIAHILNLRSLFREIEELKEPLLKIEQALPADPNLEQIFVVIQKLSGQNGLLLRAIEIGSPVEIREEGDILALPIHLTVAGSYQGFKGFLLDLEKSVRFFNVKRILFSSPRDEVFYTFSLAAEIYFSPPVLALPLP